MRQYPCPDSTNLLFSLIFWMEFPFWNLSFLKKSYLWKPGPKVLHEMHVVSVGLVVTCQSTVFARAFNNDHEANTPTWQGVCSHGIWFGTMQTFYCYYKIIDIDDAWLHAHYMKTLRSYKIHAIISVTPFKSYIDGVSLHAHCIFIEFDSKLYFPHLY